VIGVLPPLPQYPDQNDVYMPTTACPFRSDPEMMANRSDRMMNVFGLMKPGVSLRQASLDLNGIILNAQRQYPNVYPANFDVGSWALSLREQLTQNARPTMLVLLGAAGFVLLIACANVTNLNLARMVKRERELAVRAALGAGRNRLFRQLLTESFLLALAGAALGLVFAQNGLSLLISYVARFTPRAHEIHLDGTVLLFTVGIAVLVSLVSGSVAALDSRGHNIGNLKEGSSQSTIGIGRRRLRNVLIISQVAVSFLLLIGAGLMLRSFLKLQQVDPGFDPENVLTMRLNLNFTKYNTAEKRRAFYDALLEKVQAQPGVLSVAGGMTFPLSGMTPWSNDFTIEGRESASLPIADFRIVTPGYFKTLHIPLLEGRDFTRQDRPDTPIVAIVNRTAAHRFWGTQDPVGKRVSTDKGKTWIQIVGVVGDVKQYGLDKDAPDEIYIPLADSPAMGASLIVKTSVEPLSIARRVIQQIYDIDPDQPAARVASLEQVRADSVAAPRLTANLLGLFALLALAIAAAGIGGVMALSVSQRTHEIGVRMAIGAWPREILRMVLGQGVVLTVVGLALGLLGAIGLTRMLRGLLFEVTPTDPLTFVGVGAVLAIAALSACYVPARRAARVDPTVALRCE
jgi:putative ABC transport system permease protein